MLTASSGSPEPVKERYHAVELRLVQMVPALVMNAVDCTCGYGDDVCAGASDVDADLRMR